MARRYLCMTIGPVVDLPLLLHLPQALLEPLPHHSKEKVFGGAHDLGMPDTRVMYAVSALFFAKKGSELVPAPLLADVMSGVRKQGDYGEQRWERNMKEWFWRTKRTVSDMRMTGPTEVMIRVRCSDLACLLKMAGSTLEWMDLTLTGVEMFRDTSPVAYRVLGDVMSMTGSEEVSEYMLQTDIHVSRVYADVAMLPRTTQLQKWFLEPQRVG